MRSTLVVVLALLVLAVAVLAVALQGGDTGSVEPGEIPLVRDGEPTGYRSAVDPSPDPAPAAGRVRAAATEVVASLRLRCVDRQGSPVAGCRIGVAPRAVRSAPLPEARWHGVTAADGTCSIALDDHQDACVVWIRGEGIATALGSLPADPAQLRDLGDVVVHPGRRVRLRFVDGEARAVRDVWCELAYGLRSAEQVQPVRSFTATSDESGAFDLDEPLATGPWGIQVSSAQLVSERVFAIDAGPGPQQLEFVVVPPEAVILGVVVDDQGVPVSRANVWATIGDRHVSMPCQTDADGSFVLARAAQLTGLFRGPVVRLAAGRSGMDPGAPVDAMWGERAARLVVRSGVGFTVLLRDEHGAPVEAAQVQLHGNIMASGPRPWAVRSGHFPGGRVVFDSLSRGEAYLRVTPGDPRLVQPDEPLLVISDAGPFEHTVTLLRAHARLLRVVGPDGAPVAGSTFELVRLPPGTELSQLEHVQAFASTVPGHRDRAKVVEQQGETDADGTAMLYGRAATGLAVRVRGAAHVPAVVNGVRLDDPEPLEIAVGAGATVRVQLGPPELIAGMQRQVQQLRANNPRPSANDLPSLFLSRSAADVFGTATWPPSGLAKARVDLDEAGRWSVSGIPAGRWSLWLSLPGGSATAIRRLLDTFDLAPGQTIERTYARPDLVPAHLDGRLMVDGNPPMVEAAVLVYVRSYPPEGGFHEQHYRTPVARDGSFALSGLPGDWTLHPTWRDAVHGVIQAQGPDKLVVASGEQRRVEVSLRMGRATLVLRDAAGQPVAGAKPVLRYLDGRLCADLPPTDADGRTQSGLLDCTPFEVLVPPRRLLTNEAQLEFARTAGPTWRLLLGKQMVRLGVVTPQPQGIAVELVAPPPFEQ